MLSLACRDAGVKDCDYVARGETEEELWKDGTQHVVKVHGMKAEDVTQQFKDSHRPYSNHSWCWQADQLFEIGFPVTPFFLIR